MIKLKTMNNMLSLKELILANKNNLSNIDFTGANLIGGSWKNCNFTNANFKNSKLNNTIN